MNPELRWYDNHLEQIVYSKNEDLNFIQTPYFYQRQKNCTRCRKDFLLMTYVSIRGKSNNQTERPTNLNLYIALFFS